MISFFFLALLKFTFVSGIDFHHESHNDNDKTNVRPHQHWINGLTPISKSSENFLNGTAMTDDWEDFLSSWEESRGLSASKCCENKPSSAPFRTFFTTIDFIYENLRCIGSSGSGDYCVFQDKMKKNNKFMGNIYSVCTYLINNEVQECKVTYQFFNQANENVGDLMVQGILDIRDSAGCYKFSVVGGTGCFGGASGTISIDENENMYVALYEFWS